MRFFSVRRPSTPLTFLCRFSSIEFSLIYAFCLFYIGFPGFLELEVFLNIILGLILLIMIIILEPVFKFL